MNPFPRNFEPLLLPFLGIAGARAMAKHRDNTTIDWQNVIKQLIMRVIFYLTGDK